ncbi:MAG: RlmE family RNA methyltransferase, partial [Gammaproteobacteria bacterium]|nr:RlmE family RNA methyltransferase [Gammaproteobacteria bacterium]
QRRDVFTRQAAELGRLSRAHYKLQQLDERFNLLKPQMKVLELGAAPGGWTNYLEQRVTDGLLIVCDPRPVAAAAQTVVIEGVYGEAEIEQEITDLLEGKTLDLVLSDMAPNMTGIRTADQVRSMDLVELATDAADRWLKPGGNLVVKLFQGSGVDAWVANMREQYGTVRMVKPKASRAESREVYAVAQEFLAVD